MPQGLRVRVPLCAKILKPSFSSVLNFYAEVHQLLGVREGLESHPDELI